MYRYYILPCLTFTSFAKAQTTQPGKPQTPSKTMHITTTYAPILWRNSTIRRHRIRYTYLRMPQNQPKLVVSSFAFSVLQFLFWIYEYKPMKRWRKLKAIGPNELCGLWWALVDIKVQIANKWVNGQSSTHHHLCISTKRSYTYITCTKYTRVYMYRC